MGISQYTHYSIMVIYGWFMDQLNHSLGVNALVSCRGDVFMESNDLTLGLSFKPTKFKWVQNLLKHILTFLHFTDKGNDPKSNCPAASLEWKIEGLFSK